MHKLTSQLDAFWHSQKVAIIPPHDCMMGAATFHYATVFYALQKKDIAVAFTQPCRRPQDGRSGKVNNRLYMHHQYQVVLRPVPFNIKALVIQSLENIGISTTTHEVKFVEDNWQSPSLGASGLGWEVLCDNQEVLQFTYFQTLGGKPLDDPIVELAYGIERLQMIIDNIDTIYSLPYVHNQSYGEIRGELEREWSKGAFYGLSYDTLLKQFHLSRTVFEELLANKCYLSAYEECIRLSHLFNLIDCNNSIGHHVRTELMLSTQKCFKMCISAYAKSIDNGK